MSEAWREEGGARPHGMHELRLIQDVVDSLLRRLHADEGDHDVRVRSIRLCVGELELHSTDDFRRAFQVVVGNTPLQGATLDLSVDRARVECPECGFDGPAAGDLDGHQTHPVTPCPRCGRLCPALGGRGVSQLDLTIEEIAERAEQGEGR